MRFALCDNIRVEAEPKLKGLCPVCSQSVRAKCGTKRSHHWAHYNSKKCDHWWETETDWHRTWKNNFPSEWQEFILHDEQTGEKHIADVRTVHELVIEFQHSPIKPQERTAREQFHRNMVWVVNGTRLKNDYRRFLKGKNYFYSVKKGVFRVAYPKGCFPSAWLNSSVPVVFDFKGIDSIDDLEDKRSNLYCLFPNRNGLDAYVAEIPHKTFINTTINGKWLLRVNNYMDSLNRDNKEWPTQETIRQQESTFERLSRDPRYGKRRRLR